MKKKSKKNLSLLSIILIIVLVCCIFILTPTENPLQQGSVGTSIETFNSICLPGNNGNVVYHPNYWMSYSEEHEQAQWVATVLTADKVLMPTVDRSDNFIPDPLIATGSAVTSDYTKTGYDRGHILSFASNGWDEEAGQASFYMSNMSPQKPNTNRYTYERLEEAERTATVQNGVLCVVHGPVLSDGPFEKIGKSTKISVPNYYFVCFLDYFGDSHKSIGFLIPNDDVNYKDILQFAVSVNEIEKLTGIDFWVDLPDAEEEYLEDMCNVSQWDFSSFNRSKAAQKYGYDLNNPESPLSATGFAMEDTPSDPLSMMKYFLYENFGSVKIDILTVLGLY